MRSRVRSATLCRANDHAAYPKGPRAGRRKRSRVVPEPPIGRISVISALGHTREDTIEHDEVEVKVRVEG